VSPILVRPVREQFEHDRVIRVLQAKYKRKYEVAINPGAEQNASVGVGDLVMYPDLVLFSQERSRKMQGTIEVETTESVNTLEAMAEWGPFSRLRAAFFLYVPANTIDTVRRLCADYNISPAEIWTYHTAIDQVRFTMVHRSPDAPKVAEPRVKVEKPAAEPEPVETRKLQSEVRKPAPDSRKPNGDAATAKTESRKAKVEIQKLKGDTRKPKAVGKASPAKKAAKPAKPVKPVKPAKTAKTAKPSAKAKKAAPKKRR
jgi:hypothetical protein